MRIKRILSIVLALMAALTVSAFGALAEGDNTAWWQQDVWDLEHLLELGAQIPTYNAASGQY